MYCIILAFKCIDLVFNFELYNSCIYVTITYKISPFLCMYKYFMSEVVKTLIPLDFLLLLLFLLFKSTYVFDTYIHFLYRKVL